MATNTTAQKPIKLKINISRLELAHFTFKRKLNVTPTKEEERQISFELGMARLEHKRIGIELQLDTVDWPELEASVAYRAIFSLPLAEPRDEEELEEMLKETIKNAALPALFPFLRETITTATQKAGIPNLTMPLVDIRNVFSSQELQIPKMEEEVAEPDATIPKVLKTKRPPKAERGK